MACISLANQPLGSSRLPQQYFISLNVLEAKPIPDRRIEASPNTISAFEPAPSNFSRVRSSTPSAGDRQPACRAGGISVHGKRRTGVEVIQKYTTSMAGRWKTRPRASRTRPCSTSSTSRTTGSPASPSAMPASQRRYIPRSGSPVGPLKSLSAIRLKKTNGPVRAKRGSAAGEMLGKGKWARGRFRDDCLLSAQSGHWLPNGLARLCAIMFDIAAVISIA